MMKHLGIGSAFARALAMLLLGLVVLAPAPPARADSDEDDALEITLRPRHVSLGVHYVQHVTNASNSYDALHTLVEEGHTEGTHLVTANTKCGSFVALLLKNAYPFLTEGQDIIEQLTGSPFPDAQAWYVGIALGGFFAFSHPYVLERQLHLSQLRAGDIMAADYEPGHVMVLRSLRPATAAESTGHALEGASQYIVQVIDSSQSPHSFDSRVGGAGDDGIGTGTIRLYASTTTGAIVAWKWSLTASQLYWADPLTTCPAALNCVERPMMIGRLVQNDAL